MSESPLLTLSRSAQQHIAGIIERTPEARAYRLAITKTGCNGYMYVSTVVPLPPEGVATADHELLDIALFPVYVDSDAVPLVKGSHIDYVEKSFGMKQLLFQNPNAVGECGCGESFNIKEAGEDE